MNRPASGRSAINRVVSKYLPPPLLVALRLGVAVAITAVVVFFVVAALLVTDDAGIVVVVTNKVEVSVAVSLIKADAEISVAVAPTAAELFSENNITCLKSTPKFSKQYF